jgi:hypothetical protein
VVLNSAVPKSVVTTLPDSLKIEHLDGTSVDFDVFLMGERHGGKGLFRASLIGNAAQVSIEVSFAEGSPATELFSIHLSQELMDRIKPHPQQTIARWILSDRENV